VQQEKFIHKPHDPAVAIAYQDKDRKEWNQTRLLPELIFAIRIAAFPLFD
jgi:hypothetical protein